MLKLVTVVICFLFFSFCFIPARILAPPLRSPPLPRVFFGGWEGATSKAAPAPAASSVPRSPRPAAAAATVSSGGRPGPAHGFTRRKPPWHGERERQPLAAPLPRTTHSSGRSKSEPARAREARDRRGHPVPPASTLPLHPGQQDPRVLRPPTRAGAPRACPRLPLGERSPNSEVMENLMGVEQPRRPRSSGSLQLVAGPALARRGLGSHAPLGRGCLCLLPCAGRNRSRALPPAQRTGILQL